MSPRARARAREGVAACGAGPRRWLVPLCLAVLVLMPVSEERKYLKSFAGRYWYTMIKHYNCSEREVARPLFNFTFRPLNFPRTQYEPQRVTARASFLRDLTDSFSISMEVASWNNNQWKEGAVAKLWFRNKACSVYRTVVPELGEKLFRLDVSSKEPCVIPKGEYFPESMDMNFTFPDFPQFFYGVYRSKVELLEGKNKAHCSFFESRFSPLLV